MQQRRIGVDGVWQHMAHGQWVRTFPAPCLRKPAQPVTTSSDDSTEKWLREHAGLPFVPAQAPKARPKKSKFEGARPGWCFKTGDHGLGYYPDVGTAAEHNQPRAGGASPT